MTEEKKKKRYFAKHAKSSAMVVSLAIHGILILVAISFVAVTVIQKEEQSFEAKTVKRPKQPLKKLKVPVKVKKAKPKPKLRQRIVVKNVQRNIPVFQMPEMAGVKGGLGSMGDGEAVSGIGFSLPEIDFFGAKGKGEKVLFIVHFGPATIGGSRSNPFTRMTGYTIRKRLEDMVNSLPPYTLFNVFAYFVGDTIAMNPTIMLASDENKQKVMDWMAPVNPLEGSYKHCFDWDEDSRNRLRGAQQAWPTIVTNLPFYSMKWAYPYEVPNEITQQYLPEGIDFKHWGRAITGAVQTQKPDVIFILTTNYIDGWGNQDNGEPNKMLNVYKNMFNDVYGPDKESWPSINVVVLESADRSGGRERNVSPMEKMSSRWGPVFKGTGGEGSVIEDITEFMTDEEKDLMDTYRSKYGQPSGGRNNR